MESVKSIRAVERAFAVLKALQGMPDGAALVELQRATELSGPTLLRILKTLIAAGVVRRSMTDQRYRNTVHLQTLAHGGHPYDRLADVAAPWLDWLRQKVEWPSDLLVHSGDDDFMRVIESNLRQAKFFVRRRPGRSRVNLLGSAAGLSYLSALPRERRNALIAAAKRGNDPHNIKIIALDDVERLAAQSRRNGYALRHPAYRGGSYSMSPRDDHVQAIAIPLVGHGIVLGALNINWNRSAFPPEEMAKRHLPALKQAAQGIFSAALESGVIDSLSTMERAAK